MDYIITLPVMMPACEGASDSSIRWIWL